jgi:hypothetical protein
LNTLTDFDAVSIYIHQNFIRHRMAREYDHTLFLNTNMAEKPEAPRIQHNALRRTYLGRQTKCRRNFNDLIENFASPYVRNIIVEIPTSTDTGNTK